MAEKGFFYTAGKVVLLAPLSVWEGCLAAAWAIDYLNGGVAGGLIKDNMTYATLMGAPLAAVAGTAAIYKSLSFASDVIFRKV